MIQPARVSSTQSSSGGHERPRGVIKMMSPDAVSRPSISLVVTRSGLTDLSQKLRLVRLTQVIASAASKRRNSVT